MCIKDLFRSVSLHWRLEMSTEYGAECGFVFGALLGLEEQSTARFNKYHVAQNHLLWFNLVFDTNANEPIELDDSIPPIIMTFHPMNHMLDYKSVSLPEGHFFSSNVVYSSVGLKFNYATESTNLVKITNQVMGPFPERLLKAVSHSIVLQDRFNQAIACLMDELFRIRPIYMLYPTEDRSYVSCYFAGMLAANLDGDHDVAPVKSKTLSSGVSSSQSSAFLIVDYVNNRQICLNLISLDKFSESTHLSTGPMIGDLVRIDEQPTSAPVDQVVIFNTHFGYRHTHEMRKQNIDQDYVMYGVVMSTMDRAQFHAMFSTKLLRPMTLKRDLKQVLKRELALDDVMSRLHTLFGTCKYLLLGRSQNMEAMLDGLFHYDAKVKSKRVSVGGQDHVARYVLNMDELAPLSLIVNDETCDLTTVQQIIPEILKIYVSLHQEVGDRVRFSSHATFGALHPSSILPRDSWVETSCPL